MSPAVVHLGVPSNIIEDYYRFGQRETVGPAQIETGTTRPFTSLEELVDGLLASTESTHVVICHGNPQQGILTPFTAGAPHNATGEMVDALTSLAQQVAQGWPPSLTDPLLVDAVSKMGVSGFAGLRLLGKLAQLRLTGGDRVLHFRACNIGQNTTMLGGYKLLFNAALVTAPTCRMLYLRLAATRPPHGTSIAQLAAQAPTTPNTRRRMFGPAPDGSAQALLLDVQDIDGHTNVLPRRSLMDNPGEAPRWGELLAGRWTNRTVPGFVLPILWCNSESSFHTPLELSYRDRLTYS